MTPPPATQTPRTSDSQSKALLAASAAAEKQAEQIVVLDIRSLSTVADFFVLASAETPRQLDAIKNQVETALHHRGWTVWHTEGAASWILLDCGDVIVHLFDQPSRAFYRIEELWADAPRLPIPVSQSS